MCSRNLLVSVQKLVLFLSLDIYTNIKNTQNKTKNNPFY